MRKVDTTIDELSNRRQYFRVMDKVSIEFTRSPDPENSPAEFFELNPEFGLLSEFQLIDVEAKHLMISITDRDKVMGQYLKAINRKLDMLAHVVALIHQSYPPESVHEVNLSEGGFSIITTEEYDTGQFLAIKLILLPSCCGLLLTGKVLSCIRLNRSDYELHIEFNSISEPHQQLIARHIMHKQTSDKRTYSPTKK